MKKPRLILDLAKLAPNVAFDIRFERDRDFRWDGDGPDPEEDGYAAYDVDVVAAAIVGGELIERTESMGGHYEDPGNWSDDDLGGYLPQMLQGAAKELSESVDDPDLRSQLAEVIGRMQRVSRERYDEQMKEKK